MPMISTDEAWRIIASHLTPLPSERLPRRQAAGRYLAASLAATTDVPAADVSAMDGYAVAGEIRAGDRRPVAATVPAGAAPGMVLPAGAAVRIMTGAPVPAGADRVVPVELTVTAPAAPAAAAGAARTGAGAEAGADPGTVEFTAGVAAGDNVRRRGEVQRSGDPLLPAGALLTPSALALLATHGHAEVEVHRQPTVAILATGDEVVPPDRTPSPGQLRDSHTDFLLAATAALGRRAESLGIAPDQPEELAVRIRRGLEADVLLVCGGVSMGEFDFVEGVFEQLGCHRHFDAVAVQPGKPLVFATHPGGIVFGLPGNPASVMVDFWLFVRPALARLAGQHNATWDQPAIDATLATPLPGAGPRERFVAAEVTWGASPDRSALVWPLPPLGSHDLVTYAHGTVLIRIRPHSLPLPAGGSCEALLLPV